MPSTSGLAMANMLSTRHHKSDLPFIRRRMATNTAVFRLPSSVNKELFMYRTHTCGELRPEHAGQEALLAGWVHRRRDHGPLIFIDLRDRYGLTQVVFDSTVAPEAHAVASQARSEYVIQVRGLVGKRPEEAINPDLLTGAVEVRAVTASVLNVAKTTPL